MKSTFRRNAGKAADFIVEVMNDESEAKKLRFDAAKTILDYGVGKPAAVKQPPPKQENEDVGFFNLPSMDEITTPSPEADESITDARPN